MFLSTYYLNLKKKTKTLKTYFTVQKYRPFFKLPKQFLNFEGSTPTKHLYTDFI